MSRDRASAFARELASFGVVGGLGLVVDVTIFNFLVVTVLSPSFVPGGPLLAKLVSTTVAIAANWVGNRLWTFRHNKSNDVVREGIQFVIASVAGLLVSIGCLWFANSILGLTTLFDDNIATNVVGLALGTAVRFALYRWWVFAPTNNTALAVSELAAPQKVDAGL